MMQVAVLKFIYACSRSFYTGSSYVSMTQRALAPFFIPTPTMQPPIKSNMNAEIL
jgi:hypothetical protein